VAKGSSVKSVEALKREEFNRRETQREKGRESRNAKEVALGLPVRDCCAEP
jgi:hypothetical protein